MPSELIGKIVEEIRRGNPASLDAYLTTVVHAFELDGTQTKFYNHMIALDGDKNVRLDDFIEFIIRHILSYVIPRARIQEAKEKDDSEKLGTYTARLIREAEKLFTPLKKTGEGGEMLLFILGEVLLGLPQLFCKMSVKTAGGVHYHGADGIHAGVGADGSLELYWGESKLHKTFDSALTDCIKSISPILKRENDADLEDLLLLQTHFKLSNPAYTEAIKHILNKDNKEFNSVRYCGLCLIGFNEDVYDPKTTQEIIEFKCNTWKGNISKKLKNAGLDEFTIHFFSLPVVCVDEFRKRFLEKLGLNPASVIKPIKKPKNMAKK